MWIVKNKGLIKAPQVYIIDTFALPSVMKCGWDLAETFEWSAALSGKPTSFPYTKAAGF